MDAELAESIALSFHGARGYVPRGPTWLLGYAPVEPDEVALRCGRPIDGEVWRVQVGGRFLSAAGEVYPDGIPYIDELFGTTAIVASEVWLYVDIDRERIVGLYTWPEAIRKPIATRAEAGIEATQPEWMHGVPEGFTLHGVAAGVALLVAHTVPDPLSELLLYECGGLTFRATPGHASDLDVWLAVNAPPFVLLGDAVGREPGRPLGPQTQAWPAQLQWWTSGFRYELRGNVALSVLDAARRSLP